MFWGKRYNIYPMFMAQLGAANEANPMGKAIKNHRSNVASENPKPTGISDGKSIYKWRKFQPRLMTYSRWIQMVCLFIICIQCNEYKWRLCNVISSFQSMCVGLMDLVQQPVGAGLHLHSSCMIPILQMSNGYMGRDQNLWHHMLGDRQFNYHLVMTVT